MKEKENFMDKNTLIAVVVIFAAWLGWDAYMRKNYPPPSSSPVPIEDQKTKEQVDTSQLSVPMEKKKFKSKKKEKSEKTFLFESPELTLLLSSKGMGFKKIVLSNIRDRQKQKIKFFDSEVPFSEDEKKYFGRRSQRFLLEKLPFETTVNNTKKSLDFEIQQTSKTSWKGTAVLEENVLVEKTLKVLPEQFAIEVEVNISGQLREEMYVKTFMVQMNKELEQSGGLFALFNLPDLLSLFVSSQSGIYQEPFPLEEDKEETRQFLSEVPRSGIRAVAMGSKYFGQAFLDDSPIQSELIVHSTPKRWVSVLKHTVLNSAQDFNVSHQAFMGPKILRLLKAKYPELVAWVDFGFFSSLSRFILEILSFFHSLVGNWGFSIILLTLLVRILLLPLVLSSHRSMAVMKKIQPELQKIREKFKKDPQRMNQEVMALMKTHRANPLGGCLPMLLQIPVFWALWRALSNSYSLYQSPFILWIKDLSDKDPFYVLPALIGAAMFVQQKISPAIGNKEMARAMQILPIFMAVIMITFPSGLTLYVLISTVFGLLQQVYMNKQIAVTDEKEKT